MLGSAGGGRAWAGDGYRRDALRGSREGAVRADLGEPYPWLANIRCRRHDAPGALAAAERGVELQPDLPEAHYFSGAIHDMMAEHPQSDVRRAPAGLQEALRLEPRFHPAWLMLGATAIFAGRYEEAVAVLSGALRLESEDTLIYRFVGAHTLKGIALARATKWEAARKELGVALERLKPTTHLYRDTFSALSACVLGEIDLRTREPGAALAHFRHAGRIVKEAPRMAGSARLLSRIEAGLAAAYATSGDAPRGRALADAVHGRLDTLAAEIGTVTFESGLSHLHLALAVAELHLGRPDGAAALVELAWQAGWADVRWLRADPALQPLATHPAFVRVLGALGASPPIEIHVPAGLLADGG